MTKLRSDLFLTKRSLQILYSLGIQASGLAGGVPRDQCFVFKTNIGRVKIGQKWLKNRVWYCSNFDAAFNVPELCLKLSGDVHPTTGQFSRTKQAQNAHRGHVMNNCTRVQIRKSQHLIRVNNTNGQPKQLEIAHLNMESLKCGQHFHEVKEIDGYRFTATRSRG